MELRWSDSVEIEDLRNHPAEQVEHLRELLLSGTSLHPDPRRRHFYEVQNGSLVYYIHVPPTTGKVHLLAVWSKQPAEGSPG